MSPLERAGKALFEGAQAEGNFVGLEWRDASLVAVRGVCINRARAVLQAIREPSEAMIYANSEGGLGFNDRVISDWQAMIDAALEEG